MILVVSTHDNGAVTLPAGWTIIDAANSGTTSRGTIAWRRAGASESAPTVTHTAGDSIIGTIASFSGCLATGSPVDVFSSAPWNHAFTTTPVTTTVTATAITPTATNEMIVFGATSDDNVATADTQYANWSGTNPTFAEGFDSTTTNGSDSGCGLAYGVRTTADSTGSRTVDITTAPPSSTNNAGVVWLVALKSSVAAPLIPRRKRIVFE